MNNKVVLSGLRSDSHTWGLAFLQLWLEERGFCVSNMGSCVMPEDVAAFCREISPALVALTSVNGHGAVEAAEVMTAINVAGLSQIPVVVGGKLTTSTGTEPAARTRLMEMGCAGVFVGQSALPEFSEFLHTRGSLDEGVHVTPTVAA